MRLIIFLDDILIIAASKGETKVTRNPLIYLLQGLSFLINIKKLVLRSLRLIEFGV